jgi:hypothetical protein
LLLQWVHLLLPHTFQCLNPQLRKQTHLMKIHVIIVGVSKLDLLFCIYIHSYVTYIYSCIIKKGAYTLRITLNHIWILLSADGHVQYQTWILTICNCYCCSITYNITYYLWPLGGFFFFVCLWGYWYCGHFWPIVPASGESEDDCREAEGM